MKNIEKVFVLFLIIFIYIYINYNFVNIKVSKNNIIFSIINENNNILNQNKIDLMTNVINNMYKLKDYLYININLYPNYSKYINLLYFNLNKNKTIIHETSFNNNITSYTINKGEKIFLCIKNNNNNLHDINIIMYVAIHEMAHIACPTIGHDILFQNIFKFLIKISILINIYKYDNYFINPIEYCNIQLNSFIL